MCFFLPARINEPYRVHWQDLDHSDGGHSRHTDVIQPVNPLQLLSQPHGQAHHRYVEKHTLIQGSGTESDPGLALDWDIRDTNQNLDLQNPLLENVEKIRLT